MACAHRGLCRDRGRHNSPDDRLVHRRRTGRSGSCLLHAELWLQITLFFAVSVVLLTALRPLVKKYLRPRTVRTNAAGNIGREAIVTEAIDNLHETGAVRLSGVEWTARSADGSPVAVGTVVRIDAIEGVKLIVTPVPVSHK